MNTAIGMRPMMAGPDFTGIAPLGHGGLGLLALLGFLTVAGVVAALIVWAIVRRPTAATNAAAVIGPAPAQDSALAIVRERLARGEIDPEQYTAIVSALST